MKNEDTYYQEVFQQMKHLIPNEKPQFQTCQQLSMEVIMQQVNESNEQAKNI